MEFRFSRLRHDSVLHLGTVVTLRFSVLDDWEWSLKETLRTLTGLGGTIRKGIPDQKNFVSFFLH